MVLRVIIWSVHYLISKFFIFLLKNLSFLLIPDSLELLLEFSLLNSLGILCVVLLEVLLLEVYLLLHVWDPTNYLEDLIFLFSFVTLKIAVHV